MNNNALIWILSFVYEHAGRSLIIGLMCIQSHGIRAKKSIWSSLLILVCSRVDSFRFVFLFFLFISLLLTTQASLSDIIFFLTEEFGRRRLLRRATAFFLSPLRMLLSYDVMSRYSAISYSWNIPERFKDFTSSHFIFTESIHSRFIIY